MIYDRDLSIILRHAADGSTFITYDSTVGDGMRPRAARRAPRRIDNPLTVDAVVSVYVTR